MNYLDISHFLAIPRMATTSIFFGLDGLETRSVRPVNMVHSTYGGGAFHEDNRREPFFRLRTSKHCSSVRCTLSISLKFDEILSYSLLFLSISTLVLLQFLVDESCRGKNLIPILGRLQEMRLGSKHISKKGRIFVASSFSKSKSSLVPIWRRGVPYFHLAVFRNAVGSLVCT